MSLDPHCSMCGFMLSCLHPSRASPITSTIATAPDPNPRPWPCLPAPMQAAPQTLRARQKCQQVCDAPQTACIRLRPTRTRTRERVCPTHSFRPSPTDQPQTLCRAYMYPYIRYSLPSRVLHGYGFTRGVRVGSIYSANASYVRKMRQSVATVPVLAVSWWFQDRTQGNCPLPHTMSSSLAPPLVILSHTLS
jgi:hypothetical protein